MVVVVVVVRDCWKISNEVIVRGSCKGGIPWPGDLAKRDVVAEERGSRWRGGSREKKVQNGPEARMKWKGTSQTAPTVPQPRIEALPGVWLGRLSKNCMNCMNIVRWGGVYVWKECMLNLLLRSMDY